MIDTRTTWLSTTTSATATGMSQLFDGNISHDKVTRFLSNSYLDSSTVWQKSRPLMLLTAGSQQIQWRYVLADRWFSSAETMEFIQNRLKKHYVMAVESSRTVAVSQRERFDGRFERVDAIAYPDDGSPLEVYLRSVKHRVLLVRRVFTNKDGSQGVQYLLSNDTTLDAEQVATIYKRRWRVEEYHKLLKQHTAIGKSPRKTVETQFRDQICFCRRCHKSLVFGSQIVLCVM